MALLTKAFSELSRDERFRWHAYMRVWRERRGFMGTNPCDPKGTWIDEDYTREAERVWDQEHYAELNRRPRSQTAKYAEAEEAREAWARAHGCRNFEEAKMIGIQLVGKRPVSP